MYRKKSIEYPFMEDTLRFQKKISRRFDPIIPVILKNPNTNEETKFTHNFLVDTGASISILTSSYKEFVKKMKPIDFLEIRYGAGTIRKVPIYEIIFIIKGIETKSIVAYDDKAHSLLLGIYGFLDKFAYNLLDHSSKKIKLYKY